ncbi:phosphotransferase family protein [Amycolatopsis sp. NPDC059090]|uniref:phosphotransferase family protein n=1 Tax=unclassified Amycolatopsis TaxID=2618356 RepID=UPI00366B1383
MASAETRRVTGPEDVTPEWLGAVLHRAAPESVLTGITRTELTRGRLGRCVRFGLSWDGPGGPAAVVGKFPAAGPVSRQTGTIGNQYATEVEFYRTLGERVCVDVPRCHAAEAHDDGGFVLILDWVDGAVGDQAAGATLPEAETAVDALARLHAQFSGSADLPPPPGAAEHRRTAALYQLLCDRFLDRFGDRLSAAAAATVARFKRSVRGWTALWEPPFTLLHGDYRLDNLLFRTVRGHRRVTVLDWQTLSAGPGPKDLAYLLGGSLDPDLRRSHETALVDRYVRTLRAHGTAVPDGWLHRTLRLGTLSGLHMTVVGSMLVESGTDADRMFAAMAERHAAHAADHDALRLLESMC